MKALLTYHLISILAMTTSLFITSGSFTYSILETVIMYIMFMVGTLGYIRPMFTKPANNKRRGSDVQVGE